MVLGAAAGTLAAWRGWFFSSESCSAVSDSLRPQGLYSPWNSPGQNTGVGGHSLLQGIISTQGLKTDVFKCFANGKAPHKC